MSGVGELLLPFCPSLKERHYYSTDFSTVKARVLKFTKHLMFVHRFRKNYTPNRNCPAAMTTGRLMAKEMVENSTDRAHSSGWVSVWME